VGEYDAIGTITINYTMENMGRGGFHIFMSNRDLIFLERDICE
jgi:hypothetical protein